MKKKEKITKNIGRQIQTARKYNGLTRKELANELYYAEDTVKKWENGINTPTIHTIHDLSNALDEPALQMMGFDNHDAKMTSFPFFLTEEETQLFHSMQKMNPRYTIEQFWLDAVLPGRKVKADDMDIIDKIAELLYENSEVRRMFSTESADMMARMKDMFHPMRKLEVKNDDEYILFYMDGKEIYRRKPTEQEPETIGLGKWFENVLFEVMESQKERFSTNEVLYLCNALNELSGYCIFSPSVILEPSIDNSELNVRCMIPNELIYPRKLSSYMSDTPRISNTGYEIIEKSYQFLQADEKPEEYIVRIFRDFYGIFQEMDKMNIDENDHSSCQMLLIAQMETTDTAMYFFMLYLLDLVQKMKK